MPGSRLHAALGGTLYLENVPEASTRIQRRLSRLLRDREVLVDGSSVVFDVRCITGGGEELAAAVREGRLEDALHRRLTAVKVDLPPLRNRREDIAPLANRFLRDICAAQQVPLKMFSRSALALFTALPWRSGNAGELRELLQLVVRRSSHRGIGVEDVLAHVRLDTGTVSLGHSGTLRQARTRFEHEYIASVLRQHRGRFTQAAKTLGIQRTNLYRKMRTLNVAQPRVR
jgi:DNA-binding NtrC family response regulator